MNRMSSSGLSLLLLGSLAGCREKAAAPAPPPPEVKVAQVLQRDVPVYIEAIGETRGNTEIEIRARVEGFIESVDYPEGSLVEKGQRLYTIDARPFQARLAATKASQAEAARAHQDVARYEPLVAKNAISREEYETAVSLEKAAAAVVEAARAVVEQAEIDLSYTKVLAPEAGLAGRTEVYAGTLVGRGQSTLLTRISRIDPIHARFSFAERDYLALARKRGSGVGSPETSTVPFELVMADGHVHPESGKLVYLDRNVDALTGTIMAEAAFANPGHIVRPGQYARVRALMEQRAGAILVPQRAVQEMQGVFSVNLRDPRGGRGEGPAEELEQEHVHVDRHGRAPAADHEGLGVAAPREGHQALEPEVQPLASLIMPVLALPDPPRSAKPGSLASSVMRSEGPPAIQLATIWRTCPRYRSGRPSAVRLHTLSSRRVRASTIGRSASPQRSVHWRSCT
jgi:membrane fusion protein (multidrug efflux system)